MSEFNEFNYDDEFDFDEDFANEDEFFDCNSTFVWDCPPNQTSNDKELYATWKVLNMIDH